MPSRVFLFLVLLPGCLSKVPIESRTGFLCTQDEQCGEADLCVAERCSPLELGNRSPLLINCGGAGGTDKAGRAWLADRDYLGGSVHQSGGSVEGTEDDFLYTDYRWGNFKYRVALPCPSRVKLRLHFAERALLRKGGRLFDVLAEGIKIFENLDVYDRAGAGPLILEAQASADDGLLELEFVSRVEDAMFAALEVEQRTGCVP